MHMKNLSLSMVLALSMIAAFLPACGKSASDKVAEVAMEKAIESSAAENGQNVEAQVDLSKGTVSISGQNEDGAVDVQVKDGEVRITTAEGAQEYKASEDGNTVTMTTPEGTMTATSGPDAKVPDNFPKDIPLYAGATLASSTSMPQMNMAMVQLSSTDSVENVSAFYKKEMPAKGWTELSTMSDGANMHMLNYSKDGLMAMISVASEEGKTVIAINCAKE